MKNFILFFALTVGLIAQPTTPINNARISGNSTTNGTLQVANGGTLEILSGSTIKADAGSTVTGLGSAPFNISNFTLNGFLAGNGTGMATIIAPVNNNIIGWNGTGVATAFPFNSTTVNTTLGALATLNTLPWALLTGTPTTAAGYGITHGSLLDSFGGITTYSSSGLGLLSIGANVSASNLIATALFLNSAEPLATMNVTNGSKLDGLASNLTGITGNVPVANVNAGTMQGGMTIPSGTFSGSISGTLNGGVALNAQTLSGNGTFSGVLTDSNATLNFTGLTGNGFLSLNGTGKVVSTALANGQIPYWTGGAPTALTINSTTVNTTLGNLATANASGNLAITGGNLDITGNLAALSHNLTASGNVPAANVGNGTLGNMTTTDISGVSFLNSSLLTGNGLLSSLAYGSNFMFDFHNFSPTTTGTGTTSVGYMSASVSSGATSSNYTAILGAANAIWNRGSRNDQFESVNWNTPHGFYFNFETGYGYTNLVDRITIGKSSAAIGALTTEGVGFTLNYSTGGNMQLQGCYYNGTAGSDAVAFSPTQITTDVWQPHSAKVLSYGNGTVNWWVDGVLRATVTTGPMTTSSANQKYLVIEQSDLGPDTIGNLPAFQVSNLWIITN